jgi:hypothetical protein
MTSDVTTVSMTKRLALITYQFCKFDQHFGAENQIGSAFMARKMKRVGPIQGQGLTGWAGGLPAGARTGGRACNAHGYGSAHRRAGAGGEGAAKVRVGGNDY